MALFDAFLKIDGITGEHKGEIQLESFSWGVSNTSSAATGGSGAGAGKAVFQDFSFSSRLGRQSPELFMNAVRGTNFPTAELSITESNRQITITFSDVFISSYKEDLTHTQTTDGGALPLEIVSLNFAQVQIQIGGGIFLK